MCCENCEILVGIFHYTNRYKKTLFPLILSEIKPGTTMFTQISRKYR